MLSFSYLLYILKKKISSALISFLRSPAGRILRSLLSPFANFFLRPAIDGIIRQGAFDDFLESVVYGRALVKVRKVNIPLWSKKLGKLLDVIYEDFGDRALINESELIVKFLKKTKSVREISDFLDTIDSWQYSLKSPREFITLKRNSQINGLRILMISGIFASIDHAGGLRLFDVLNELKKRNEVTLFSIYDESLDKASMIRLNNAGIEMRLVSHREFNFTELTNWLSRNSKSLEDFDVILLEYPDSALLLKQLETVPIKTIFTLMEGVTRRYSIDLMRQAGTELAVDSLKTMLNFLALEKEALQRADEGIAVTDADADFAARVFRVKRPHVVQTGLSPDLFVGFDSVQQNPKNNQTSKSAAFIGYYGHSPNVEAVEWYLKEVHPKVKAQIPGFKFYVIGRGDTQTLEAIAQGDPSVIFTGRVESIFEWLKKATICISPLHTGSGFRGKINQYSAAGRPTVSTSIGICGLPYIDDRDVLEANTPEEFATSMINLINDPILWNKIQSASYELAMEHFSWQSRIRDLEALF